MVGFVRYSVYLDWRSVISMISEAFENTIKDELRLHYDLNLCSLVEVSSNLPFDKKEI